MKSVTVKKFIKNISEIYSSDQLRFSEDFEVKIKLLNLRYKQKMTKDVNKIVNPYISSLPSTV